MTIWPVLSNVPVTTRISEFCYFRYSLSGRFFLRLAVTSSLSSLTSFMVQLLAPYSWLWRRHRQCVYHLGVDRLRGYPVQRLYVLVVATLPSRCLPTIGNRLGIERVRGYPVWRLYALPTEHWNVTLVSRCLRFVSLKESEIYEKIYLERLSGNRYIFPEICFTKRIWNLWNLFGTFK